MAKWDTEQNDLEHKLYGSPIKPANAGSYEFQYAVYDIDDDGLKDAVILLKNEEYCGTGGCTMRILKGTRSDFVFQSETVRVIPPVMVLSATSHGWKSLAVALRGGGFGILAFDRKRFPLSPNDDMPISRSLLQGPTILIESWSQ